MNALTRSLEHALRSRGLPYQIVNGLEFYQRKEVKDLLAYLHLINNPNHDVAFMRAVNTPTRGIGAKTVQRLQAYADREAVSMLDAARRVDSIEELGKRPATMVSRFVKLYDRLAHKATASLEDLIRSIVEETEYEAYLNRSAVEQDDTDPMANVDELITSAVEFDRQNPEDGSLELYLEQVALVADTDAFEDSDDRVTLMTLHAAKGLEFPCVFIVAVEDETLPHKRSRETEAQLEEERRLMFVGITRAQQRLQLSCCKRRTVRGYEFPAIPSPFLNELPTDELRVVEARRHPMPFDEPGFDSPFDAGGDDFDYPDSWDLEADIIQDPGDGGFAKGGGDAVFETGEICQLPEEERQSRSRGKRSRSTPKTGLTTAANLMSTGTVPLAAFQEGVEVRHAEYGLGTIVSVTGRGPKRTAEIRFEEETVRFRLMFAELELA